jgi:mannose/fructose/N-acetylgalactosamine-specific phosphotransferase system component IID
MVPRISRSLFYCKFVLQRRLYRHGRPRINRPLVGFVNHVTKVVVIIVLIVIGIMVRRGQTV